MDRGSVNVAEFQGAVSAEIVGDYFSKEASALSAAYIEVVGDPLVATGFPAIEISNIKVSEEAQTAYTACDKSRS